MNNFTKRLAALLSVKSIVTLVLTAVFAYLAVTGKVSAENYMTVFTVIIAFYFGTQSQKVQDAITGKDGATNDTNA